MLIDEMLDILDERERYRKKHEMGSEQAAINKVYNDGLD